MGLAGLGSDLAPAGRVEAGVEAEVGVGVGVDVELGVGVEAVGRGSLLRKKRRGSYSVRSGPQTGSAWIKAPGTRRTESFFRRYREARRVSWRIQREVELWVRWRRSSRYAERRSGQAGSRAVVSIWWVFLFVTCPFGDGDGSVFIVVVVVMMAPISVRSSSRRVASE